MHGAVAATEVVCYASRKLVAKCDALQTTDNRQQAPRAAVCIVVVSVTDERNENCESGNTRNNPFLWLLTLDG